MTQNNCEHPSVPIVDKVLKHLDKKPKLERDLVKGMLKALYIFAISLGFGLGFGLVHYIITFVSR